MFDKHFFYLMPSFPTDNFGSQLSGKSNLPDANYCVWLF